MFTGIEMVVQFGYITMFSAAFPIAAFMGLIANIIELRSDAFKLCYSMQVLIYTLHLSHSSFRELNVGTQLALVCG
jgi:hypothetical protein